MSVILITGASGGIAQELVKQTYQEHHLILVGRNKQHLDNLYGQYTNIETFAIDLRDEKALHHLVYSVIAIYGRIDILINNAGFGSFKVYSDYSSEEIDEMFAINTIAVMNLSRLVALEMDKNKRGHIITIASMAGLVASAKSSVYSATKFAVIGFSNALRLELADKGIYVTTINPGPVKTKFFNQADPSGEYLKKIRAYSLSSSYVASKIISCFNKPKREVNMPFTLALVNVFYHLFPKLSDFLSRKVFNYK